jgi:hypothetical protein
LEDTIMSDALRSVHNTGIGRKQLVTSARELLDAASDPDVRSIAVSADLSDLPAIRLAPGTSLLGQTNGRSALSFAPGVDGLCLSTDNTVMDLDLFAEDDRCAIWNDESASGLGTLTLCRINTTGRVRVLARGNVRSGHLVVQELDIVSADASAETDRPHEYGVDVLQGGFTLWNMQPDENAVITADLTGLSAGRSGAPVLGSGIFVSGGGETGGRLEVQHLRTREVYSNGCIEPGTAGLISGGVFVVYGTRVDLVETLGQVITYGPNDMALDNWGVVERWISKDKITTFGPSGVGFVNFGTIGKLQAEAPIETFGQGARGFNVYTGTVRSADFDRIVTHGDGAVGVQISQPVGQLAVRRGIETFGAVGDSLVKGVVMKLPATGLSIKAGGSAQSVCIEGGLRTHGKNVIPLEQSGSIQSLRIEDGFSSRGESQ